MFHATTVSKTVSVLKHQCMNQEYINKWNRTGSTEIEQNSFEISV